MLEDPEDTNMSSEGPKTSSEDHQTQAEKEEEDLSSSKKGRNVNKVLITFAFNALNPLN